MRGKTKSLIGGAIAGLVIAGMLAMPSVLPPAIADEEPFDTMLKTADELLPPPLDAASLWKPDEVFAEPWVSTQLIKQQTIRKIGYGRTSFVKILTTPTGTYSTDGLASRHIRYPGIHSLVPLQSAGGFLTILSGKGWMTVTGNAGSFVSLVPIAVSTN